MSEQNHTPSTGPSHETVIRERLRGEKRGEKNFLAATGFASREEAMEAARLYRESRAKKPEGAAAEVPADKKEAAEKAEADRIAKLLDEHIGPIKKRFADEDARREADKKAAEEAAAQKAKEAEAEAAYKKEVRWFKRVAASEGALVEDADALDDLTGAFERALKRLPEDEFEEKFGEDVSDDERAKNAKAILAKIKARSPGLFKVEDKKADGDGKDGKKDPPAEKKEGGTTGKPASPPGEKPAGTSADGTRPPLDVTKLSKKQFEQFKQNPQRFRDLYNAGQITYEGKK